MLTEKDIRKSDLLEKAAYEEAEHAAKFAELLGEVVTDSTKKNLEMRVDAETELQQVNSTLQNVQKQLTLTQSMIQFMRWQETKQDTEKHLQVCLRDTSVNKDYFRRYEFSYLLFFAIFHAIIKNKTEKAGESI